MNDPADLSFPDAPRLELDDALVSLLEHAERVRLSQGRLRALLHAIQAVVEQRDLAVVLRQIVESALELVDAEYGALGVIAPERDVLEEFIYVGLDAEEAARIGELPTGHGLLGALIADPRPIRLPRMDQDDRAAGFPPHHPTMTSFLGVPIRIRGEVFGNLYLTNRRDGSFTTDDEQLVEALASTAGFAIENARLLEQSRMRTDWMQAAAELSAALLVSSSETALDLVAGRICDLQDVDQVVIMVGDHSESSLAIAAARGSTADPTLLPTIDPSSTCAQDSLEDGRPRSFQRTPDDGTDPARLSRGGMGGPVTVVPLRTQGHVWGVVCIARAPERHRFSSIEVEIAADLVSRACIAIELSRAREERQRVMLVDDRRRIARDLHDHVIQQLYGTGLSLQAAATTLPEGAAQATVQDAVEKLDDAISQIRTVVFALSKRDENSLRHRIIDAVAELSSGTRRPPAIKFAGPVDHSVAPGLSDDVVAVVRELLSNAVRHAHADRITVDVSIDGADVVVVVEDDGVGVGAPARTRGLRNLLQRATDRGGTFTVKGEQAGTRAEWRVPLDRAPRRRETSG